MGRRYSQRSPERLIFGAYFVEACEARMDRPCLFWFSPEPFPEGKPAFHSYPSTATRQCKGLYFQRKIIPSRQKCRSSSKRQLLTRFPPLQSHSFPLFLGLPRNLLQGQRQMHWQLVKTNQPLEVEQPLSCLVRFGPVFPHDGVSHLQKSTYPKSTFSN